MCTARRGTAVFTKRIGRKAWEEEVAEVEKGAAGTPDQIRTVTAYLVKYFDSAPKRKKGGQTPFPPNNWSNFHWLAGGKGCLVRWAGRRSPLS
jgi:hypothetical protein